MRLKNKVALITGGTMGIGKAIAMRFADEGAKVAVSGRSMEALQDMEQILQQKGQPVMALQSDVQYKEQAVELIAQVMRHWGRLDIMVSNAGICKPASFLEMEEQDWDNHLNINLKGTFLIGQQAAKEMVKSNEGGSIINMSSVNGLAAEDGQAHYNASKGGINLLTMSMALELAPHKIRVNALCPGFIDTRLTRPLINQETLIQEYVKSIPMGRVGTPEEVASAVVFLASEDSGFMTGHCMVIDGGQFMKLS
jgi:glucose 1-dehydrogenase